jgi:DNA-binding transcriptional ArsR family regulator
MGGREAPDFSVDRAELFEALGHPTRIRILQALGEGPLGKAGVGKAWLTELSGGPAYVRSQTAGWLAISPSEWTGFDFTGEYIVMFLNTGSYSLASSLPLDETLAFAGSFQQSGGS